MYVYLKDYCIKISKKECDYMIKKGIIIKIKDKFVFNKFKDFKFLYNSKLSKRKRKKYIDELNNQNFICQECGRPHSYCISPYIDENNVVDFNKIVCCCNKCRINKLQKRNIVQPIYKKKLNYKKLYEEIDALINKYNIKDITEFKKLCVNIFILENYVNLVLPIHKKTTELIDKKINLHNLVLKKNFKKHLFKQYKHICPICGKKTKYSNFTIDHIIAKNLGGEDNIKNLIGMCYNCNQKKSNKTILEFLCTTELTKMPPKILNIALYQQEQSKILLKKLYLKKDTYIENNVKSN